MQPRDCHHTHLMRKGEEKVYKPHLEKKRGGTGRRGQRRKERGEEDWEMGMTISPVEAGAAEFESPTSCPPRSTSISGLWPLRLHKNQFPLFSVTQSEADDLKGLGSILGTGSHWKDEETKFWCPWGNDSISKATHSGRMELAVTGWLPSLSVSVPSALSLWDCVTHIWGESSPPTCYPSCQSSLKYPTHK